jgi:F-type H+-transporting ATPase subunit b
MGCTFMSISVQEILTQALGFVLLLLILKKIVWKPLLDLLETRRSKIVSSFEEIERTKAELARFKAEYETRLGRIEEEAHAKFNEAILEGKKLSREIQEAARNQAKEILEKAKEDITQEARKAQVELKREIAGLVMQTTERLIREKLTEKKDEEMILKFIQELEESKETFGSI